MTAHTHHATLTTRSADTGGTVTVVVAWADHASAACPVTGVPRDLDPGCPVILDGGAPGREVREVSQQCSCGCGTWHAVDWAVVDGTGPDGDVTDADVTAERAAMGARRDAEIAELNAGLRAGMVDDLRQAMARLAEPLDDGEVRADREEEVSTGSLETPGVYLDDTGTWSAWAERVDAVAPEDVITVTEADL